MPKVKWIPVPPSDALKELCKNSMKAQNITSTQMGELLGGKSGGAVRCKLHQGTDTWSAKDIREWALALKIPPEQLGEAIMRI